MCIIVMTRHQLEGLETVCFRHALTTGQCAQSSSVTMPNVPTLVLELLVYCARI